VEQDDEYRVAMAYRKAAATLVRAGLEEIGAEIVAEHARTTMKSRVAGLKDRLRTLKVHEPHRQARHIQLGRRT
jgi:ferritin-like protein